MHFLDFEKPIAELEGKIADGGVCTTGSDCSGDTSDCITGKCTAVPAVP